MKPAPIKVEEVVAWLERKGNKRTREGMARFAIPCDKAFGVPMGVMQQEANLLGRNHDLAAALWHSGWYESSHDGGVRGRAEARNTVADGSLVPGLRQLGYL